MNLCSACQLDFGSVFAFDAHRVGKHAYLWSPDQEDGRRCLDVQELERAGWRQGQDGRWRTPKTERPLPLIFTEKPAVRFAQAANRPRKAKGGVRG